MRNQSFRYICAACILIYSAIVLQSCTVGPKIYGNANPNVDFSDYKTYNYQSSLDTDKQAGVRSVLSNFLINATDREMQARGYTKAVNSELEIQFSLNTKEKIGSRSPPGVSGGYYGNRGLASSGSSSVTYSQTEITQYTEGTLNIDLVDNENNELAWEGIAIGNIHNRALEDLEAAANRVVAEIFQKYPYYAAGFVPPPETE